MVKHIRKIKGSDKTSLIMVFNNYPGGSLIIYFTVLIIHVVIDPLQDTESAQVWELSGIRRCDFVEVRKSVCKKRQTRTKESGLKSVILFCKSGQQVITINFTKA